MKAFTPGRLQIRPKSYYTEGKAIHHESGAAAVTKRMNNTKICNYNSNKKKI